MVNTNNNNNNENVHSKYTTETLIFFWNSWVRVKTWKLHSSIKINLDQSSM